MTFLRVLFTVILILYAIRMLARILLPMLFQSVVNKAANAQQPRREQQKRRTDGAVSIDFIPPKDKEARAADKAGDFIDYEEIK